MVFHYLLQTMHKDGLSKTTNALARLLRGNVAFVGLCALHEAVAVDLKALLDSRLRLKLVSHSAHL